MAARPTDRIVSAATGVLALGRTTVTKAAIKAARAAQPLVARVVGAVRTRVEPPLSPVSTLTPDASAPTAHPADPPVETTADASAGGPTPRTVAKNIPPHPPAPQPSPGAGTARRKTSAPGAKLPVRKGSPGSDVGA
ncbi:hypothetical protein [Nocardioides psychrotolerans]|uniref:hypothetical protein n=1 Tax=Nocardioides psychrotolerans TaxID=1005945 RepID=UPI003137743B